MFAFLQQSRLASVAIAALAAASMIVLVAGCGGGGGGGGGGTSPTTVTITGQLKDQSTALVLPNRVVTVTGTSLKGTSNAQGQFTIAGVTVGTITLTVVDSNGVSNGTSAAINLNSISGTTRNVEVIALNITGGTAPPPPPVT